jgi:signal transduction histidine kinase
VARRWRIRYKLMLALATAIAILAMLLAGTLNGLWSYHITMKYVEGKLKELNAAAPLKDQVAKLALPDKVENSLQVVYHLKDTGIQETENKLSQFEDVFQTNQQETQSEDDGVQVEGDIAALRQYLAELRELCSSAIQELEKFSLGDPHEKFKPWREKLKAKISVIETASGDIHNVVRENLLHRIMRSRRHYQITLWVLIPVSVLSLLLMLSALRFFYGWIFNPLRDLQQGVTRVAKGDFDHRIQVHSGDEMEELAQAYNDMTDRLRALYRDMATQINERSRQLVRSERLASVGFLAAGVAHEINNPLASIAFCSEALEARLQELDEGSRQARRAGHDLEVFSKYLKMIQEEAFRCKKITERLLEFSRGGETQRDRTDLVGLVQAVLEVTQHHPKSRGKEILFQPQMPVFAWVCVEEIKSVVINLVFNALESMDEGGRLTIELRSREGMAELVFTDTGCGMTQEVLDNIFEPFFTRSRSGKGTGLGLTITHKIVSQHGGEIEATSPGVDQGSTFRVRLPLQQVAESGVRDQESGVRNQGSGARDQRRQAA